MQNADIDIVQSSAFAPLLIAESTDGHPRHTNLRLHWADFRHLPLLGHLDFTRASHHVVNLGLVEVMRSDYQNLVNI